MTSSGKRTPGNSGSSSQVENVSMPVSEPRTAFSRLTTRRNTCSQVTDSPWPGPVMTTRICWSIGIDGFSRRGSPPSTTSTKSGVSSPSVSAALALVSTVHSTVSGRKSPSASQSALHTVPPVAVTAFAGVCQATASVASAAAKVVTMNLRCI